MNVTLEWNELRHAGEIGWRRTVESYANGRRHRYGRDPRAWTYDVLGALGECAAAKGLGIYWPARVRPCDAGDLAGGVEVRTTNGRGLFLHDTDRDDRPFVLVVAVELPTATFDLVGWIYGVNGKLRDYWTEPQPGRPCYEVPRDRLEPVTRFPYSYPFTLR